MDDVLDFEVAPGHRITSGADGTGGLAAGARMVLVYSCSCGEIRGVDSDAAQEHVDDVTP